MLTCSGARVRCARWKSICRSLGSLPSDAFFPLYFVKFRPFIFSGSNFVPAACALALALAGIGGEERRGLREEEERIYEQGKERKAKRGHTGENIGGSHLCQVFWVGLYEPNENYVESSI